MPREGRPQDESCLISSRAPLVLAVLAYALFGLLYGVWQVAIADLQGALHLSEGALGAAITIGFLASFPMMLLGGRIIDRWGARAVIAGAALLMALAFLGLFFVDRYWALAALLFVFFGASGAYDVGINAAAIGLEQRSRRHLLSYFHAAFSGAAAVTALATGGLLYAGVPFRLLYLAVSVAMVAMTLTAWGSPAFARPAAPAIDAHAAAPPEAFRAVYRIPAILLLSAIAASAFLSEGTLETWSAVYLRSVLHLPAFVGAAGPAVFHTAMLAGRLGTGRVIRQLGRRPVLRAGGLLAAGGMVLALATVSPPIILPGLLLAGLALAGIVPTVFSLAGDLAPHQIGAASSLITIVGYSGFLIGPALIGGLADWIGLRAALAAIILMGGLILLLSLWLKDPERQVG